MHSPQTEKKFVDDGIGINHQAVMHDDFILVGPADDPGNIKVARNIIEAYQRIASQQQNFLSRGDDSGANKKELFLWNQAGIHPYGSDWCIESGAGMAATLKMAQQSNAYMIMDRASFLVRNNGGSKLIIEDPINLSNIYSIIAVNSEMNNQVNTNGANDLIDWLISPTGQDASAGFIHNGQQLYQSIR